MMFSCISCVQETALLPPVDRPKVVLYGFINPDSVLSVKVSLSQPIGEKGTSYPDIQQVEFYENNQLLPYSFTRKGNNECQINYFPQIGNVYKVKVVTTSFGEVYAEDTLLEAPAMKLKSNVNPSSGSTNTFYEIIFDQVINPCYLSMTKVKDTGKIIPLTLQSSSNWLDPLGSFNDIWSGYGKIFDTFYARMDDRSKNKTNVSIVFTSATENPKNKGTQEYGILNVLSGSVKLDKYLKSLMLYQVNRSNYDNGEINNPFAEASPVYSNVSGGLGFFGCAYQKKFRLE